MLPSKDFRLKYYDFRTNKHLRRAYDFLILSELSKILFIHPSIHPSRTPQRNPRNGCGQIGGKEHLNKKNPFAQITNSGIDIASLKHCKLDVFVFFGAPFVRGLNIFDMATLLGKFDWLSSAEQTL